MNTRAIYVANGIGIYILLMLLFVSRTRIQRHRVEDRLYTFMVVGVMLGCLAEALSYGIDGKVFPGSRALNYVLNTYLFTANLLLPFSVLAYVDLGLYGDTGRIWKRYKPQIILGAVMLGLTLLNLFVPICYYITEQNVYERRPVSYVYYLVIMYYCISSIVLTKRYERENGAHAFFSINVFLIPVLAGVALQFMIYGLSLAWLASAIGLVGLFMMQQNELAYIDSLVDTYNRQYLNHILSAWTRRGARFAGVMLDVDGFKSINDRFGHSEGDRALKTVTDILKQARRDQEWVFRFAGDEFIILKQSQTTEELEAYMDEVRRGLEARNNSKPPYRLSVSYGISAFENDDIDSFMKKMDEKMYEMKSGHHRRMVS